MIEYSQEEQVNYYHSEISAVILSVMLVKNYKAVSKHCLHFLNKYRDKVTPNNISDVKSKMTSVWNNVIKGIKPSGDDDIDMIVQLADCSKDNLFNIVHSLTRIPEWFIYTESYLKNVYSPNMKNHLEDINALALDESIYPYSKQVGISDSIYKDLYNQEQHVIKFAKQSDNPLHPLSFKHVNANLLHKHMTKIKSWIYNDLSLSHTPDYAKPWVRMMQNIRRSIPAINDEMHEIMEHGFNVQQLTVSESKSYCDDNRNMRDFIIALDINDHLKTKKITALLANIFHLYYGEDLKIPFTPGQVDLFYDKKINYLYATAGPGLGPAYKIRIVYCTSSEIQNLCNILAMFLQKEHDQCYHYAYLDQVGYIHDHVREYKDVQCTDCTGYSDYLNRNIYREILSWMGVSPDLVNVIMTIFSMKVNVNGQLFEVPFGALQGVKLLVFIMNDANALLGIIQNLCRITPWNVRQNAGDDVYAASTETQFTAVDLDIDILVWLYFNCPTNISKSAWLKRDGYWDFCKVYFSYDGMPVTGIPPKFYLKEITCIRDFAQYYVVMDRACIIPERTIEEAFEILKPILIPLWQQGMALPNRISDLNLSEKIDIAKEVHYSMGGLSSQETPVDRRVSHLIEYCNKLYTEYQMNVGDIYMFASEVEFEGVIKDFLLQCKTTQAIDFFELLINLNDVVSNYKEGLIDEDSIREIEKKLESKTRVVLDSGKLSRSGSTYHRITPTENGDITLIKHDMDLDNTLPYQVPSSVFDLVSYNSIMADIEYDDISRLNKYANITSQYRYYQSMHRIEWCGGGNYSNGRMYPYLWNADHTRRYRLFGSNNDTTNEEAGIYSIWYATASERSFIIDVINYGIMNSYSALDNAIKSVSQDLIRRMIRKISLNHPHMSEDEKKIAASERIDNFMSQYVSSIMG